MIQIKNWRESFFSKRKLYFSFRLQEIIMGNIISHMLNNVIFFYDDVL